MLAMLCCCASLLPASPVFRPVEPASLRARNAIARVARLGAPLLLARRKEDPVVQNEFARLVSVASLGRKAYRKDVAAKPSECAALAERFDLEALGSLKANVSLTVVDQHRPRIRASGKLSAMGIVQQGGGGAPVTIDATAVPFETYFVGGEPPALDSGDDEAYDEALDESGQIDVGELAAQHLYVYLSELQFARDNEWSEFDPGTVVYDSGPDE